MRQEASTSFSASAQQNASVREDALPLSISSASAKWSTYVGEQTAMPVQPRMMTTQKSDESSVKEVIRLDSKMALAQELMGHSSAVQAVAFSPDGGRLASGSSSDTIRIWTADSSM